MNWNPNPEIDECGNGYCSPQCQQGTWRSGSKTLHCSIVGRVTYREYQHITTAQMCEMWAVDELHSLRSRVEELEARERKASLQMTKLLNLDGMSNADFLENLNLKRDLDAWAAEVLKEEE